MDWGLWVVMCAVVVCWLYVGVIRMWVWCQVIRGGEVVWECEVDADVGVGGVVWCRRRAPFLMSTLANNYMFIASLIRHWAWTEDANRTNRAPRSSVETETRG